MLRQWEKLFWLTFVLLLTVQALFSAATFHQLKYEEVYESIRNVYWFEDHLIYEACGNIGFYFTLLLFYKTFGFSMFAAKYFLFAFQSLSFLASAALLRRFMTAREALVPLLVIGLSPTGLYFGTKQVPFNISALYAPIVLFLLVNVRFKLRFKPLVCSFLLWTLSMLAALSYPTFLLCLPFLALYYAVRFFKTTHGDSVRLAAVYTAVATLGLCLPMAGGFFWLRNSDVFREVIFRGGSHGFTSNVNRILHSLSVVTSDLFQRGNSYYFELPAAEFASIPARIALGFVLIYSIALLFLRSRLLLPIALTLGLMLFNYFFPASGGGYPGMRRHLVVLIAFYLLFALVWYDLSNNLRLKSALRTCGKCLCSLLLLAHVVSLHPNYNEVKRPARSARVGWFWAGSTSDEGLAHWLAATERGKVLWKKPSDRYNYAEIYSALAGYRRWNNLTPVPIYAYDDSKRKVIRLSPELWLSGYLPY